MKNYLFIILLVTLTASCQDLGKLNVVASLPSSMDEVSGIELVTGSPLLWMVNDSGNSAYLFGYNFHKNSIERTLNLENLKNKDWEDLATNAKGTLYIGDFGNNNNSRKNLSIHAVFNVAEGTMATGTTRFSYQDQNEFPPKKKNRNFDAEAFICVDGHFFIFTRNRSHPFDGTTHIYKLQAQVGSFVAQPIGTFKTCNDSSDCQITAAAVNHNNGMIALLSYNKVWLLSDYNGDDFFNGKVEKIKLQHKTQKESIAFKNDSTLFIADERSGTEGGNLYELSF